MPKFLCTACGGVDSTGLTDYWVRKGMGLPALCSACSPGLRWHGQFAQESAEDWLVDGRGFLWRPRELMDLVNTPITIVGIIPRNAEKGV